MFKTTFIMANGDKWDVTVDSIADLNQELYFMNKHEGAVERVEAPAELYIYGAVEEIQ